MDLQIRDKIRKTHRFTLYISILLGFLLFITIGYSYLKPSQGPDVAGCRQVWMGPSYARIKGFDESYTEFAAKYSLYLYREQHKDKIPSENNFLDGVPVLFIPGNAGSYRQVRAIAAKLAKMYFDEKDKYQKINPNVKNLDVFAADFNEDFTAFHGRTILDQAEYLNEAIKFILDLYSENESPPKSVIIIGHSMGGIVARVMITLPNYTEDSINTILTLSSPHAAAPLTFDGDILKIYSAIDRFWFEGYNEHTNSEYGKIAHKRVKDISLISITGGGLDTTLPADYTSLGFLVPPTNGFTIFTTGVPNVWSPIDHLAIVWCLQLRQVIAESLLEVIDVNKPGKTYPLEHRMKVFRKHFLSGFENYASQDYASVVKQDFVDFDFSEKNLNKVQQLKIGGSQMKQYNLFELAKNQHFSLLSSIPLEKHEQQEKGAVFALICTKGDSMSCIDLSRDMITVPRSTQDTNSLEDSSIGGNKSPFYALELNSTILQNYNYILVIQNKILDKDFIIAQLNDEDKINYKLPASGVSMLTSTSMTIANRPLSLNIQIPNAWNSILVYKLRISGLSDGKFTSFMRQWKDEPFESKWYINLSKETSIGLSIHGVAPFVPFKILSDNHAINIQIWSESTEQQLNIAVSIDLISSLKLLVLRYRISTVSMIVSIITLVLLFQFKSYSQGGNKSFPSFIHILSMIHYRGWWIILIGLIIIQPIVKIPFVQTVLNLIDPVVIQDFNEINLSLHPEFKLNSFYLGLNESFTLVGVILYLIANFLIILTYLIVRIASGTICYVINLIPWKSSSCTYYQRIITTLILLGLMSTYLPYQIGYTICCIIQIINVVKYWNQRQELNYQLSILLLMLWILPINIPIVIVYTHNLAVNWKTPFSSHHNLLSIIPIVVFVQVNSILKLPKFKTKHVRVLIWYMSYVILYCVLYGGRHTYWLHHLMNLLCCILLVMIYDCEETQPVECK